MQTVLVPKHIFLFCNLLVKIAWKKKQFQGRTSLCFTDQEAQEEILLGGLTLYGSVLDPSPVQSSRSIQRMQTVLVLKHIVMCCDLLVKIS